MGVTALVFIIIYVTGLILTFRNPYYGVLTYIFEWHNHPPYYWWGSDVPDFVGGRWSLVIAVATLISWAIHRDNLPPLEKPKYSTAVWIALIVMNMFWVSVGAAVLPELSMDKTLEMFKILVSFLLITTLVRRNKDYGFLIWLIVLCVINMGYVAWDVGGNRDIGVMAPNATEENALSAHVMATLPFFAICFLRGNRWLKGLVILGVPFCLNLIILANSRATFVGLVMIGFASVFLFRGKFRFIAILGIVATGFLFTQLTSEKFEERQSTSTYDDGSATSRLHIWKGGYAMWKDHPFGVGGGGFAELSMEYIPEINSRKTQHNTFISVFTDWGVVGLILYLGFLIHTFIILFRIKKLSLSVPALKKYHLDATAIQLALIGITAAGMFHSRQYAEVVYWLSAFSLMLQNIQNTEIVQLDIEANREFHVNIESEITPVT